MAVDEISDRISRVSATEPSLLAFLQGAREELGDSALVTFLDKIPTGEMILRSFDEYCDVNFCTFDQFVRHTIEK